MDKLDEFSIVSALGIADYTIRAIATEKTGTCTTTLIIEYYTESAMVTAKYKLSSMNIVPFNIGFTNCAECEK